MAKAKRELKIVIELNEEEANDLYIHLNPKYHPNKCQGIKGEIAKALGYTPRPTSDL